MGKNKRYNLRIVSLYLFVLLFCSGCVAIPVGKEERFTTEYFENPKSVETIKTLEPFVSIKKDATNNNVEIGLSANKTIENKIEQQKKSVSVVKQKKIAFGLFPSAAEGVYSPKDSIPIVFFNQCTSTGYDNKGNSPYKFGFNLGYYTQLGTVYSLLLAPFFDGYECENHHYAYMDEEYRFGQLTYVIGEKTYLLEKFSKSEREKMRIWIRSDEKDHPHNGSFWSGVAHSAWFGFFKYCTFVMEGPVVVETIQHPAEISKKEINVSGPYYVKLKIPGMDFQVIKQVNAGETSVSFDLPVGAEKSSQNGVVSFSKLKLDLMEEGDEKSILEKALEKEFPISLNLPVKNNTLPGSITSK